ncbi:MAG: hypothetical protein ACXWL2_04480 [Candidatus Chromulinivorax sp.]
MKFFTHALFLLTCSNLFVNTADEKSEAQAKTIPFALQNYNKKYDVQIINELLKQNLSNSEQANLIVQNLEIKKCIINIIRELHFNQPIGFIAYTYENIDKKNKKKLSIKSIVTDQKGIIQLNEDQHKNFTSELINRIINTAKNNKACRLQATAPTGSQDYKFFIENKFIPIGCSYRTGETIFSKELE